MVRRIITFLIFGCLAIAIPLAMLGYEKVELGESFLALMRTTSYELNSFKIQIPNIPRIPEFEVPQGIEVLLNFFVKVLNALTTLINFVIMLLNVIIQLLEFIILLIKNAIQFKNSIREVPIG